MKRKCVLRLLSICLLASIITLASIRLALAHHGAVSAAFGPGTPVETSSPLTLVKGMWLLYEKVQYVPFKKYKKDEPNNVDSFMFYNTLIGYGVTDYFTPYIILPYAVKKQDGLGTSQGFGDVEMLLQLSFKYGERNGIKDWYLFGPEDSKSEDETRDDLKFSILAGFTIPNGTTTNRNNNGDTFDMGMQPGFGATTYSITGVVSKMIFPHFTLGADTVFRTFSQTNEGKAANEWRVNVAGVYEVYEKPGGFLSRADLIAEANYLHLTKDVDENRSFDDASGGDILYLSPGIRLTFSDRLSIGTVLQIPSWTNLNKKSEQQGAEGLEEYRISTSISYSF